MAAADPANQLSRLAVRIRRPPLGPGALLIPATAYLLIIYAWPVVNVLKLSVFDPAFTLDHYAGVFQAAIYTRTLFNTLQIAITAAILCLLIGYPTAYMMATGRTWVRLVMVLIVTAAYLTNVLVRNYAWIFMLSAHGVVNSTLLALHLTEQPFDLIFNRLGLMVGMVHILLPTTILVLLSSMLPIGREHLRAAASLAAGPFTAFRRAYFPLTVPGIVATLVLVFVLGSAFFTTPAMLGGIGERMMSNIIVAQVDRLEWGFASALAVVLLIITVSTILLAQRFVGAGALIDRGGVMGRSGLVRVVRVREGRIGAVLDAVMNPIWHKVPAVVTVAVGVYLILPLLVVIPISLSRSRFITWPPDGVSFVWYQMYFTSPRWLEATVNSAEIATLTTVLTLALAIPAAFGFARSRSRVRTAVFGLMVSPLLIPNIVTAISVLFFLSSLQFTGNPVGVALGHTIESVPLATLVLLAALRNFDRDLEKAAASLGAGPLRTLFRVTLPVLGTATITAALFAFMHSFNELLVALFVGGITATTLPKRMWESLQDFEPTITAVSTLLVFFAVAVLIVLQAVQRRERVMAGKTAAIAAEAGGV